MLNIVKKLVIALEIIFFVYFSICYGDILAHNLDENPVYNHKWNILTELWVKDSAH